MKVCYVLPVYWPAIGGCELHTRELARRIALKHNVKLITLINSQEEKLVSDNLWKASTIYSSGCACTYVDEGVEVHKTGLSRLEKLTLYPFMRSLKIYSRTEPLSMFALTKVFQRILAPRLKDCSLIHSIFGGLSYLSYTTLRIAKRQGIPFVFTPLLHLFDDTWRERLSHSRKTGSRFLYSPRLQLHPMGYHDGYWIKTCREADSLISLTNYEKNFLAGSLDISEDRIHCVGVGPVLAPVWNGTRIRKEYGISEDHKMVLFLGRNHELKGIEELCLAARLVWDHHPNTVFFFVGPKEGRSKDILAEYRDRRIIGVDQVDLQEKTDFLAACDIFCLPSLHESFGGVFLEAWMLEKPAIGCDIPPLRELNGNEKGGFLVNLDPDEIADRLVTLIENEKLALEMGKWGRQRVLGRYSWDHLTDQVGRIYEKLMKSGSERF